MPCSKIALLETFRRKNISPATFKLFYPILPNLPMSLSLEVLLIFTNLQIFPGLQGLKNLVSVRSCT